MYVLLICFSNRLMRLAFVPGWAFYVSNNVALGRDVQDLLWEISSDDLTALFCVHLGHLLHAQKESSLRIPTTTASPNTQQHRNTKTCFPL